MTKIFNGIAESSEALAITELAKQENSPLIYISATDREMESIAKCLGFFTNAEIIKFPAWDTIPYDKTSPNRAIVSLRLQALVKLAKNVGNPIILTTSAAISQRLMPKELAANLRFDLKKGEEIRHAQFMEFLEQAGYRRSGKAMEPGEFAIRGNIIDIVPNGEANGFRIDLFGSEIEAIRTFDPFTQLSKGEATSLCLEAASEIWLTKENIERFRVKYREYFGAQQQGNSMFEAVSTATRPPGLEFFLPLFYDKTSTLMEYAPNAKVILSATAQMEFTNRFETILEYFNARKTADSTKKSEPYNPLPPEVLYVTSDQIIPENSIVFSRFSGEINAFSKPLLLSDFKKENPYESLKNFANNNKNCINIIAAVSHGTSERVFTNLNERGIPAVKISGFSEVEKIDNGVIGVALLPIERSFVFKEEINFITEADIFGIRIAQFAKKKKKTDVFLQEAAMFLPNELVVHREHGIGKFAALETLNVLGAAHDCLKIIYDNDDKLFVPVENMDVLSHFGSDDEGIKLDRLGAAQWQMRKAKMKERINLAAAELIKTAAERATKSGVLIKTEIGAMEEFARGFAHSETEDQERAIDDVISAMASGKPMDMLVCGDVGFGKTEVALRAAFAAACGENKMQVAVITPTSLLCRQHAELFAKRFAKFPIKTAQLSRMVNTKTAKTVKEGLAEGSINIVIGTHALLAKEIKFKNLGLVIIDEEQHFGVKQKERLKELKTDVHILTLTATPIPRTLQLALSGVRDLSLITTPPVDRLAVRSFVMPFDPVIIREALLREKNRGGRAFIVTPRISDMDDLHAQMKELVPEARFVLAHGQMPPTQLEDIISKFYDGEFDALISTTIVESGLDVQTANTIIINRADRFGLGQLYQLRGRVGRGKERAYAYFLIPSYTITTQAVKRLEVMQTLDRLGAGFTLASHDMDIRGFGNLVGEEQSGHIREVGVELYQHMLEEAISQLKNSGENTNETPPQSDWSPQINLGIPVLIPESYISDLELRMSLYKRAASLKSEDEVEAFHAELIDRFGQIPPEAENLLKTVILKQICYKAAIARLDVGPKGAVINFKQAAVTSPAKLLETIAKHPTKMKLKPDQSLIYMEDFSDKLKIVVKAQELVRKFVQPQAA